MIYIAPASRLTIKFQLIFGSRGTPSLKTGFIISYWTFGFCTRFSLIYPFLFLYSGLVRCFLERYVVC